jgi:hypothetical protein
MILTILKFLKPLAPYILAALAVLFAYTWIYNKGFNAGKDDGYAKAMDEAKKIVQKMPDCNCPKVPPCEKIDFDKIRGKNVELHVHQNFIIPDTVNANFREVVREELERLEVVRTKRR